MLPNYHLSALILELLATVFIGSQNAVNLTLVLRRRKNE